MVRRAWERAKNPADRQVLSGMVADLRWTIRYMELGQEPPVEAFWPREARRRRVIPMDPAVMAAIVAIRDAMLDRARQNGITLRQPDRSALEAALQGLSEAERDVYLLIVGQQFSQREVARLTGWSLRQVRKLYAAAALRVARNVRNMHRADQCGTN